VEIRLGQVRDQTDFGGQSLKRFLLCLLVLVKTCIPCPAATTPVTERKISSFTNVTTLADDDYFPVIIDGETNSSLANARISKASLSAIIGGGGGPTNGITIQGGAGNNNTFTNATLFDPITYSARQFFMGGTNSAAYRIPVIWSSDHDSDCGDIGGQLLLLSLHRAGIVDVKQMVICGTNFTAAKLMRAVNIYYGFPDIPVAVMSPTNDIQVAGNYTAMMDTNVVARFEAAFPWINLTNGIDFDATSRLRKVLTNAVDGSIYYITGGQATDVSFLANSGPDAISSMTGSNLMRAKLSRLLVQAGEFSGGSAEYNWSSEWASAKIYNTLTNQPYPIIFGDYSDGEYIFSGGALQNQSGPARWAFETSIASLPSLSLNTGREYWDQKPHLYMLNTNLFTTSAEGFVTVATGGGSTWTTAPGRNQFYFRGELSQTNAIVNLLDSIGLPPPVIGSTELPVSVKGNVSRIRIDDVGYGGIRWYQGGTQYVYSITSGGVDVDPGTTNLDMVFRSDAPGGRMVFTTDVLGTYPGLVIQDNGIVTYSAVLTNLSVFNGYAEQNAAGVSQFLFRDSGLTNRLAVGYDATGTIVPELGSYIYPVGGGAINFLDSTGANVGRAQSTGWTMNTVIATNISSKFPYVEQNDSGSSTLRFRSLVGASATNQLAIGVSYTNTTPYEAGEWFIQPNLSVTTTNGAIKTPNGTNAISFKLAGIGSMKFDSAAVPGTGPFLSMDGNGTLVKTNAPAGSGGSATNAIGSTYTNNVLVGSGQTQIEFTNGANTTVSAVTTGDKTIYKIDSTVGSGIATSAGLGTNTTLYAATINGGTATLGTAVITNSSLYSPYVEQATGANYSILFFRNTSATIRGAISSDEQAGASVGDSAIGDIVFRNLASGSKYRFSSENGGYSVADISNAGLHATNAAFKNLTVTNIVFSGAGGTQTRALTNSLAAGSGISLANDGSGTMTISATGGGAGGTKTIASWFASDNKPPTNNYAVFTTLTGAGFPVDSLRFNLSSAATTNWSAVFRGRVPEGAVLTSGLRIRLDYAATNTTGGIGWKVAPRLLLNTASAWGVTNTISTATVPGTAQDLTNSVTTYTLANLPSGFTNGSLYEIQIQSDTNAISAFLIGVEVQTQ
jgi:hypothetical protein